MIRKLTHYALPARLGVQVPEDSCEIRVDGWIEVVKGDAGQPRDFGHGVAELLGYWLSRERRVGPVLEAV